MRTNEIDRILKEQVEKHRTPSVNYVIFNKDSIIYQYRAGYTDIKGGKTIDNSTKYNAYSVTKTFTALAILQLEEHGKLKINNSIKKYLPDFPYSSEITIKQLLTHTAGIPNPIPLSWIHTLEEHQSFDRNAFFSRLYIRSSKMKSEPNEKFAYSNLGYVFLGQLIESVSGYNYEDYIRENIVKSLAIEAEDLDFEIGDLSRYTKGYHKRLSISNALLGLFIDKKKFMGKPERKWRPFNPNYVNGPSYGGLIGTPDAFVSYIQKLLCEDDMLLSNHSKKLLFTENLTNSGRNTGMCLAWFKGQLSGYNYYSHAGGGGGFYCEIRIYPEHNTGSVIMFNRTGMTDERFLDKLDKYILRI